VRDGVERLAGVTAGTRGDLDAVPYVDRNWVGFTIMSGSIGGGPRIDGMAGAGPGVDLE
jgi:hypothetical protein